MTRPLLHLSPPELAHPSVTADVTSFTLDNGLQVLLKESHHAPIVCVSVWYRAGSKHESAGTTGLAHLLEHMMFKGTARHGKGEFDRILKENGADNNATTWLDRTNYYELIASDRVEIALMLEADRMRGALFTQEDLTDEMPVVRNELERGEDDPRRELFQQVQSMAFMAHPYHWPTIGWRSDVESITAADIHAWYDTWYHPNNAFLVLVGDFDTPTMRGLVEKHFGPIPRGSAPPKLRTVEAPQRGERRLVLRQAGAAPYLLAGFKMPQASHPDVYALDLLAQILGHGRTSRFYEGLVKKGLATSASAANLARDAQDPFLFLVDAEVAPGQDPAAIEAALWEEIERVKSGGVTPVELARARKQNRVDFIYTRDRVASLAFAIGETEVNAGYQWLDTYLPRTDDVTAEDIQRVAAEWLVEDRRTVGWFHPTGEGGGGDDLDDDAEDTSLPARSRRLPLCGRFGAGLGRPLPHRGESQAPTSAGAPSVHVRPSGRVTTHRRVLDNGMTVLVRENHLNQTVEMRGAIHAGSAFESTPGAASITAQMLERGTERHSSDEIAELLETAGASVSFDSARERMAMAGMCITEEFPLLMSLLGEMLSTPTFPADELELIRAGQLNELKRSLESTGVRATLAGYEELYGPGNPWSRLSEGEEASLRALTPEMLADHHQRFMTPDRMVLAVVGDVDPSDVFRRLEHAIPARRGGQVDRGALERLTSHARNPALRRRAIEMPDKSQVDISWVRTGISRLNHRYQAASVANFIFGGDFTSHLNRELRDNRGLTYASYSRFTPGYAAGPWVANIGVNPANVGRAMDGLAELLSRFTTRGVTAAELAETIRYLTGSHPVRLETNGAIAAGVMEAELFDLGPDWLERYPAEIAALTLDEVNEAVGLYFSAEDGVLISAGTHEGVGQK